MTKPLITVVIPNHNKAKTIVRAINSVKAQTANNFECFVVLDRCTDNSLELVKKTIRDDKRFRYFEVDFGNVADSRNYGIAQGDAPFICCIDGDDWVEPTFLERCVKPLLEDRSLGITFTGLMAHYKGGRKTQSQWPNGFNYDAHLQRKNQVPTCCIFRRVAWDRVGGYRSRYCGDGGAGSEDAAFWTAICSVGFDARQVTKKPLFNYSMEGGLVHDNKEYKEPDWLAMYPWVEDGLHPFASVAMPKKHSHPVRQYDEPKVSVIIPVGPGHEKEVRNALDSLEMQHFRQWEAIVVWDIFYQDYDINDIDYIRTAFPYVNLMFNNNLGNHGAGIARNMGVMGSSAPLILFLDADDIFNDPHALDKMLKTWNQEQAIIYTDYLGKASWDYDEAEKEFGKIKTGRFLGWLEKTQQAIIRHYAVPYNCNLAQRQPEHNPNNPKMPYFHWALVSCLLPKAWHNAIGGFDESMETWEDVDYHWRLARAGYCFYRIDEPLFLYNYDGGHRRVSSSVTDKDSRQKHQKMIKYLRSKYERLETKMCNCRNSTKQQGQFVNSAGTVAGAGAVKDDDMVLIEFYPNWQGNRAIVGTVYKQPNGRPLNYGYGRRQGERFYVHRLDQQAQPHIFRSFTESHIEVVEQPRQELSSPEPLVPPEVEYTQVDTDVELQMIDGMYGKYSAKDLVDLIKTSQFQHGELEQILEWEKANKKRKTVVKEIERILQ